MERKESLSLINNDFYEDLHAQWIDSTDHPIALLQSENRLRNPWISDIIDREKERPCDILDIGCGGGLLTNYLATKGHFVSGIDLSASSIEVAKKSDVTKSVHYFHGNAYALPFANESFDAVCAMDILEHVESPEQLIKEASRVLKPNGLFFFHTFNKTLASYILIIKGVEWFVKNTPKHMHVYNLFIPPKTLTGLCKEHSLEVEHIQGVRPDFKKKAFWKMLLTKKVDKDFSFVFTSSLSTGYSGYVRKATVQSSAV